MSSQELLAKALSEDKETLSRWFHWIKPWSRASKAIRPGRLVWLNIEGFPLHAWCPSNLTKIVSNWGKVVELKDLTESKRQIHIGRVLVHTFLLQSINEVVNLSVEGVTFSVRIMEDFIEITDTGPCYEVGDNQSRSSIEFDNLRLGDAADYGSDDCCAVPDSPSPSPTAEKLSGRVVESLAALGVIKELNVDTVPEESPDFVLGVFNAKAFVSGSNKSVPIVAVPNSPSSGPVVSMSPL